MKLNPPRIFQHNSAHITFTDDQLPGVIDVPFMGPMPFGRIEDLDLRYWREVLPEGANVVKYPRKIRMRGVKSSYYWTVPHAGAKKGDGRCILNGSDCDASAFSEAELDEMIRDDVAEEVTELPAAPPAEQAGWGAGLGPEIAVGDAWPKVFEQRYGNGLVIRIAFLSREHTCRSVIVSGGNVGEQSTIERTFYEVFDGPDWHEVYEVPALRTSLAESEASRLAAQARELSLRVELVEANRKVAEMNSVLGEYVSAKPIPKGERDRVAALISEPTSGEAGE